MARNRNAGKHPSYKKRGMSAESIRKKRAYDKKYSSTAERRKYRSELNTKNRKLGTYGNGDNKDVSHTKSGTKLESQSKNRARNGQKKGVSKRAKRTGTKAKK